MSKAVDFYFDFGSPAAYLAWTQVPKLARETGATVNYKPMLLGGVFQATGNRSPMEVPAKGQYMQADLERFARRYGVPFRHNPHFPIQFFDLFCLFISRGRLLPDQIEIGDPEIFTEIIEFFQNLSTGINYQTTTVKYNFRLRAYRIAIKHGNSIFQHISTNHFLPIFLMIIVERRC